jgi:hypothetical protein
MKNILLFLCLFATGCASTLPPTVVRVNVPVPVPCTVVLPTPPTFAVDSLPIGSSIWDQMAALRADRVARQAYEKVLEAAVKACQ